MPPGSGDATQPPDAKSAGGLASVLRGFSNTRLTRLPSSPQQQVASSPGATQPLSTPNGSAPIDGWGLSAIHMDALEQLKRGTLNERVAAASALRWVIPDYPLSPVLEIWYAGKDLIEASKPTVARAAGWELLTECVKHTGSTDIERREFFDTIRGPVHPDDFHLQLAALVDLTDNGKHVSGFDYDVFPLLAQWLSEVYKGAKEARKQAKASGNKAAALGEVTNLRKLFAFVNRVVTLQFKLASEASVGSLFAAIEYICKRTSDEEDLTACIDIIQAIITFGTIPNEKLRACVTVTSGIYCMVESIQGDAWRTIADLCRSHSGQTIVQILIDILHQPTTTSRSRFNDVTREVRSAVSVLGRLMLEANESFPQVPYNLLVDGLTSAAKEHPGSRVTQEIMRLINSLFNMGNGAVNPAIADEDWSTILRVATQCCQNETRRRDKEQECDFRELTKLISRLETLLSEGPAEPWQRQECICFFTSVDQFLQDSSAALVLDYFHESRCCFPSDLKWEANLSLVLDAFLLNRTRATSVRLKALQIVSDSYGMVDLYEEQAESEGASKLVKSVLAGISEETDIAVLQGIVGFCTPIALSADMQLFNYIVEALRGVFSNDHSRSPISASTIRSPGTPASTEQQTFVPSQSSSNIVARGFVELFMATLNTSTEKAIRLFTALVNIARSNLCENDARLTAMKLLFRLRADWADRVYITGDVEADSLATYLYRTEASLATKKLADEHAQASRMSRGDPSGPSRSSRGISFGQGLPGDTRGHTGRTTSGVKTPLHKYHQAWCLPDPDALPAKASSTASHLLYSRQEALEKARVDPTTPKACLPVADWLDALLSLFRQGCDWEIYSYVLVHLPSQLSNHGIFLDAIKQIKELRQIICDQIKANNLQEPPNTSGLRRADVAICLFHSLTMILSYHQQFSKSEEDEIVRTFLHGMGYERCAKYCIHALSICCHELPMSMSKALVSVLQKMAQIITQPYVAMHILEFLACLSRLPFLLVNFREEDFRTVFGICFRYLQYVRDKRQSYRNSQMSDISATFAYGTGYIDIAGPPSGSEDLPQYVYALAYHVITFWFLALKVPDRANHVGWIARNLFAESESIQQGEEQALVTMDFMQRVTFADIGESLEDPLFNEATFGPIAKRSWIIGNSIVTIKQATGSGWSQVTRRQPSGTTHYTVREYLHPPPPHQTEANVAASRDGNSAPVNILPSHLLVQLISPMPQSLESGSRPILLPDDETVNRTLRLFDRNSTVDGHKVGVIYIGENQTSEAEILANVSGSREYVRFLEGLGTLTRLKGATFNTQGLDREYDSDGQFTICWRDRVTEIVFHVTTQMPTNLSADPNCINKKRHVGNDFVNIIWNDSGLPFRFDTFPSDFNFVNIVITPESRASFVASREKSEQDLNTSFYKVRVMSKPGFPEISPAADTKMISLRALPGFIRLVALNASVFSLVWANRDGDNIISPWRNRLREIVKLRDKYGPKPPPQWASPITSSTATPTGAAVSVPSPPTTSLGVGPGLSGGGLAGGTAGGGGASRPGPIGTVSSTGSSMPAPPTPLTATTPSSATTPSTTAAQSPEPGGVNANNGGAGPRPHSFSSLRRSSVATFWTTSTTTNSTAATEPGVTASQRTSMHYATTDQDIYGGGGGAAGAGGSAGTYHHHHHGGVDALVESIDFSKWA